MFGCERKCRCMRKVPGFVASVAEYVRHGFGGVHVCCARRNDGCFHFRNAGKNVRYTLKNRMYVKNGAVACWSSDVRRWFWVLPTFALCSAERFLTFWLCIAVQMYKKFLSPLQYALRITFGLQCECRFRPTCSEYALGCLKKYRLPMACFLIAKRLLCCQPWGRGGWDPVP